MSETTLAPGFVVPPLHIHHEMHYMFYVLEGALTVQIGEERSEAGPGSFLCVQPKTPHTAGADGPPAPEAIGQFASNYDVEVVGPPLG